MPLVGEPDLNAVLLKHKRNLVSKLQALLKKSVTGLKWWLVAQVDVLRESPGENETVEVEQEEKALRSGAQVLLNVPESVEEQVELAILEVLENSEKMLVEGSSWVVGEVHMLQIQAAAYQPIRGSGTYVPLPDWLARKKSLLNIRNEGGSRDCFRLSVVAALRLGEKLQHRERPEHYTHLVETLINTEGLNCLPMKVSDFPKFERLNPTISLSLLALHTQDPDEANEDDAEGCETAAAAARALAEEELAAAAAPPLNPERQARAPAGEGAKQPANQTIIVLYGTAQKKQHHITLLQVQDEVTKKTHFVLVKSLHTFLGSLRNAHNAMHFCCYCLGSVGDAAQLEEHEELCRTFGAQKVKYEGGYASFDRKSWHKIQRSPWTVYYDFECVLPAVPPQQPQRRSFRTQEHKPVAFSLLAVDWQGNFVEKVTRHHNEDEDVAGTFLEELLALEERLHLRRPDFEINFSPAQWAAHQAATVCDLCHLPFAVGDDEKKEKPGRVKAADHDHLFPEANFRFSLHQSCNSAIRNKPILTVIGHNANRYDMHCVFRSVIGHPSLAGTSISVLAKTADTYRAATFFLKNGRQLRFLDSFQFVASSLDEIGQSLADEDLDILKAVYPDPEHQRLLKRKGIYPYEFATSHEQMEKQTSLPSREDFFSSLSGSMPSEEEYERAGEVWAGLGCASLMDYCLHYLQTDVVLLAAFMTKYKKLIFSKYSLEVNHFVSSSSLSLTAMYKFTGARVQRVSDPAMHTMLTSGIKGGYAAVHKRYAEANVPDTPEYRPDLPENHIMLFDINAVRISLTFAHSPPFLRMLLTL